MAQNSNIEWTDHTANFWWGCFKVSDGCKGCYAETLAKRYGKSIWGPAAITKREMKKAIWKDLLRWDRAAKLEGVRRRVFVSSMSDFLEDHPDLHGLRREAVGLISQLENLDVLILTKRPENARDLLPDWYIHGFPEHVWVGTSVENQAAAEKRIPELLRIPARIRFLSVEPMLGPVRLIDFNSFWRSLIHWVICGGESGPKSRPMELEWARSLHGQCEVADVSFFMKQLGGHPYKRDKLSDFPEDLRVREFPK